MKTIAVMAHYDIDGVADQYLVPLLTKLNDVCEKIVIVSTSGISQDIISRFEKVEIIVRNNEGYDFLSYKIGIDSIKDLYVYDRLIVLNDSFYVTERFDLENLLQQSTSKDIFGITSTNQFRFHIQSYFFVISKNAILSLWFQSFWKRIFTYKRKIKIIFNYEMELTSSALQNGLTVGSALSFNHNENPCHANVEELFQACGLLKVDVVRNKIKPFDIYRMDNPDVIISHLERTSAAYQGRIIRDNGTVKAGGNFFEVSRSVEQKSDVAVIIHLYYPELADEIKGYLNKIPANFDVFITLNDESNIPMILDVFSGVSNNLHVAVVENKGRDVYPFVMIMKNHDFNQYEMVLKLHTKKSKYSVFGDVWRRNLFNNLLPSSSKVAELLEAFRRQPIGIAANQNDYLSNANYWGANKTRFNDYCHLLGLNKSDAELFFVGGTMFWFNPKAIYPIVELIQSEDFEEEFNQQDGTLAHVFERLTCMSARSVNLKVIDIENHNEVNSSMVINNEVIVLK